MSELVPSSALVTVGVVSFNAAPFILETLESIKKQDYSPIQLIISDDGSSDLTPKLIVDWVKANESYFFEVIVLVNQSNVGVSENCNRILNYTKGHWIKLIAADDLLASECISSFVGYITKNTSARLVFSDIVEFDEDIKNVTSYRQKSYAFPGFFGSNIKAAEQHCKLLDYFLLPAPAAFINVSVLRELGGFDSRFPMIEDAPLWLKFTKNGYRILYLEQPLVFYRQHAASITKTMQTGRLLNEKRFYDIADFIRHVKLKDMHPFWRTITRIWLLLQEQIIKRGNSRSKWSARLLYYFLPITDPHLLGRLLVTLDKKLRPGRKI